MGICRNFSSHDSRIFIYSNKSSSWCWQWKSAEIWARTNIVTERFWPHQWQIFLRCWMVLRSVWIFKTCTRNHLKSLIDWLMIDSLCKIFLMFDWLMIESWYICKVSTSKQPWYCTFLVQYPRRNDPGTVSSWYSIHVVKTWCGFDIIPYSLVMCFDDAWWSLCFSQTYLKKRYVAKILVVGRGIMIPLLYWDIPYSTVSRLTHVFHNDWTWGY